MNTISSISTQYIETLNPKVNPSLTPDKTRSNDLTPSDDTPSTPSDAQSSELLTAALKVGLAITIGIYSEYYCDQSPSPLGHGATGCVFAATGVQAAHPGRPVETLYAIKKLHPTLSTEKALAACCQEVTVSRQLEGQGIPRVLSIFYNQAHKPNEWKLCIVQELIHGKPLSHYLQDNQRIRESHAKKIFRSLAQIVDHAHSRHVSHRDLKPDNILVQPDGTIKVIDWGIACIDSEENQLHQSFHGTIPYMAPDFMLAMPDLGPGYSSQKIDIWSLGVILYQMLTGKLPFATTSRVEEYMRHVHLQAGNRPDYDGFYLRDHHFKVLQKARISSLGIDLIQNLLTIEPLRPNSRPSAKAVLAHPWLSQTIRHKKEPVHSACC